MASRRQPRKAGEEFELQLNKGISKEARELIRSRTKEWRDDSMRETLRFKQLERLHKQSREITMRIFERLGIADEVRELNEVAEAIEELSDGANDVIGDMTPATSDGEGLWREHENEDEGES